MILKVSFIRFTRNYFILQPFHKNIRFTWYFPFQIRFSWYVQSPLLKFAWYLKASILDLRDIYNLLYSVYMFLLDTHSLRSTLRKNYMIILIIYMFHRKYLHVFYRISRNTKHINRKNHGDFYLVLQYSLFLMICTLFMLIWNQRSTKNVQSG